MNNDEIADGLSRVVDLLRKGYYGKEVQVTVLIQFNDERITEVNLPRIGATHLLGRLALASGSVFAELHPPPSGGAY